MKKVFAVFAMVLIVISLCSCHSKNAMGTHIDNETKPIIETYEEVDGVKHEVGYLLSQDAPQQEGYIGKNITLVGEIQSVDGISTVGDVHFLSKLRIKTPRGRIFVNTSGQEELISNWEKGDVIMIQGQINLLDSSWLMILQGMDGADVVLTKLDA